MLNHKHKTTIMAEFVYAACASYVFGSALYTTIEVINEEPSLTELNGTVEVLEIDNPGFTKSNISRCVLPSSEIIDRRLTPKTALPIHHMDIQQLEKTFKINIRTTFIDYYKIQGKTWMSNTHIGPIKRRVQFHTAFYRRWPLTLTVAAVAAVEIGFTQYKNSTFH